MNKTIRISLYVIYVLGLLIMLIFSGSKYDWISDIAPSITSAAIEDNSNNRFVFLTLVLFAAVLTQVILFFKSADLPGKRLSLILIIIALVTFYIKAMG